jgi:hypothetical protein
MRPLDAEQRGKELGGEASFEKARGNSTFSSAIVI